MSNKKPSSIEWVEQQFQIIIEKGNSEVENLIWQQAKQMHKEEIVNTWTEATAPPHEIGLSDTTYILAQIKKAEQYYNETFGGNNES